MVQQAPRPPPPSSSWWNASFPEQVFLALEDPSGLWHLSLPPRWLSDMTYITTTGIWVLETALGSVCEKPCGDHRSYWSWVCIWGYGPCEKYISGQLPTKPGNAGRSLQNTTLKNSKVWSKHRNDSSAKSEHIRKWDGCIHLGADFSGFLPARAHRLRCVIHAQHSTFDPGWDRRGECALPKCPGLGVVPFVSQ